MQTNESTWHVIINPVAGGNKAIRLWRKIKPLLIEDEIAFQEIFTQHIYHAVEITKEIVKNNGKNILIVGGDGTAHEVINGIFSATKDTSTISVAMLSAGAGNDWVRTIGKPSSINVVPTSMKKNETFLHDAGIIEFTHDQQTEKRYFINIAGFAFEGLVVKKLLDSNGILKGTKLQYWGAIFRSLLFCKHAPIQFIVDGRETTINTLSVAAGICNYNGGGLKQLPNALYNDGLLDMTVIGEMSKLKMVLRLPKLTDGSLINMKEVRTFRGREIIIKCDKEIFAEADGEFLGTLPVKISIVEKAIKILKW
ncbi:MAG: diacylglycerol kinase family lipid kinase [Fimbriimonadaceae bacterium]|nr:diacylglycerol kinase family lipid kinase [Chitinophagales bacterium]